MSDCMIEKTRRSGFMREFLSTLRKIKVPFLSMVLISALAFGSPATVIAEEGEADLDTEAAFLEGLELDREWAEDRGEQSVVTKALGCNTSNHKYCHGLYDELITWVRYYKSGLVEIFPVQAVRDQAAQICTLYQGNKILINSGEPYADRLINQITVAKVLGERFRLDWATGTSGYCEIKYIIIPY